MKAILTLACILVSLGVMAQSKAIELVVQEVSTEGVTFLITISVAGVIRFFEKRKIKRQLNKDKYQGKI
jgi:hypothetical protein